MYAIVAIVMLLFQVAPQDAGDAQERDGGRRSGRFAEVQQKIQKLIESTRAMGDWDRQAELSREAVGKFFDRAGWNSSEDNFAQELFRAVDAQPPWEPQSRAKVFFQLLGDRYQLDDDQRARLQEITVRTALRVFVAQGDKLLEYVPEMIQTRAAGEPFTPEQIARWSKLAEPVMNYATEQVHDAAEEFMQDLRPEQRERVQRDLDAGQRRVETVREFMTDWKAGRWQPSDWGMEDDPIQIGKGTAAQEAGGQARATPAAPEPQDAPAAGGAEPPAGASAGEPRNGPPRTGEPRHPQPPPAENGEGKQPPSPRKATASAESDPWSKYVIGFIAKYSLDERQSQQAALIGDEARKRADETVQRDPKSQAAVDARPAPLSDKTAGELEKIFSKLKLRLERLPTRAQRKAAAGIDLPDLEFRSNSAKPVSGRRGGSRVDAKPASKPGARPSAKP